MSESEPELFSVFNFFCFFSDFFVFAAADGFVASVFVSEAIVFAGVAAAVTFERNLEILLENSVNNNNESGDAYESADSNKDCLQERAVILLHGKIPFVMGFVSQNTVLVYHIPRKIQYLFHEFFIKNERFSIVFPEICPNQLFLATTNFSRTTTSGGMITS